MRTCTDALYENFLHRFPFRPDNDTERFHVKQLAKAEVKIKNFSKKHRHTVFLLTDSLEVLTYAKACHAFSLGLSLGLSLARELELFQDL